MIILAKPTEKVQAVMSGAANSTNPTFITAVRHFGQSRAQTSYTGVQGALDGTTAVDIIPAPGAASPERIVESINIYNDDNAAVTITIQMDVDGTTRILARFTIQTLETLEYTDQNGWAVYDANGAKTMLYTFSGSIDLNGTTTGLILDGDGDTSISSPTDDQIDIEIGGFDDFTFTANAFNVLAGSDLNWADSAQAQWGDVGDIMMAWDGTRFNVTQATADSEIRWGVDAAGIDQLWYGDTTVVNMKWDQSADSLIFTDDAKLVFGDGSDDTIQHDGTNTTWVHKIGDLTFDNQLVTGSTIFLLGTDTTAVDFQVQNNSGVAGLAVTPLSAAASTVTTQGHRNAVGDTAVAITGATTLTLADSGGIFTVSQGAGYDINLPSPSTGPGLTFLFSVTAVAANDVTITVDAGAATFVGSIVLDASVIVATGSTLTFSSGNALLGDNILITSIATNMYHVMAVSSAAGGITIA